jgi:hypothetical protein
MTIYRIYFLAYLFGRDFRDRSPNFSGRKRRREAMPGIPVAQVPRESARELLRRRLIHAGLYKKHSSATYYMTQAALAVIPVVVGFGAYTYGAISLRNALIIGAITGIAGVVFPGLWLDYQKALRQTMIRRAIPMR